MKILNRYTNQVIFKDNSPTTKETVENAVQQGVNLSEASLQGANLLEANLTGVNLSRANLRGVDLTGANLSEANLSEAYLLEANLLEANLTRVNLSEADLWRANLTGADLSEANLRKAYLWEANLSGVKNFDKRSTSPLYEMFDKPGIYQAYKLVNEENQGPWYPRIIYEIGKEYSVEEVCSDERESCGAGINLAILDWCLREKEFDWKILVTEFNTENMVIPIGSDGKFRVRKCKIIEEWKEEDE